MRLPRNILVPTDFSETAKLALDYAVALAGKLDAKVHLLNVITIPALGTIEMGASITPGIIDSIQDANQKELERLIASYGGKASFGLARLEMGDARSVIDDTARAVEADLIVMGTHGRRGVSRILLGSVAEAILRTAPCPVLTVRPKKA